MTSSPAPLRVQYHCEIESGRSGNLEARLGLLKTPHGDIETPIFMPVGTAGSVKGVLPAQVKEAGAQIILANTYHLWLRPGIEILKSQGGLRKWMNWRGPLLTDSGGFQVFSLSDLRKITEEGVHFQSHIDGKKLFMSPEVSIEIQEAIASTIMMVLDICPALPATREELSKAIDTTTKWAKRCLKARLPHSGALFAIVQGGTDNELRKEHIKELTSIRELDREGTLHEFDGYALGGYSVGEAQKEMIASLKDVTPALPADRPRYLMGVGTPADLLNAVATGLDMFDCVMPTRNARNGSLFTSNGAVHIRNAKFTSDSRPLDAECSCPACTQFSASYLRHLYNSGEMLGPILGTLHNLHFYLDLMKKTREAIRQGVFEKFRAQKLSAWKQDGLA